MYIFSVYPISKANVAYQFPHQINTILRKVEANLTKILFCTQWRMKDLNGVRKLETVVGRKLLREDHLNAFQKLKATT